MRPPSHSDPNSVRAADSVASSAARQRASVLDAVDVLAPVAAWEIEAALGLNGNSVRPRLVELEADGRIEKHGKSKTPTGRSCHLYRVKPQPVVLVQERAFDAPEMVVPHG